MQNIRELNKLMKRIKLLSYDTLGKFVAFLSCIRYIDWLTW